MWSGVGDFLAMGGYAPWVWGSYGVFAALLILEGVFLVRRRRQVHGRLIRRLRRERAERSGEVREV